MELKRVGVASAGKIFGIWYAAIGLLIGGIVALASLFGAGMASVSNSGDAPPAWLAGVFGLGAIVIMPVFYGVLGFVMGLITALIYNLCARFVGGLELELR
jgi:hypothetical protein